MDNFFRRVFDEDLPSFIVGCVLGAIPGINFLLAGFPYATDIFIWLVKFVGLCATIFVTGLIGVITKDFYLLRLQHRIFKEKKKTIKDEQSKKDAA